MTATILLALCLVPAGLAPRAVAIAAPPQEPEAAPAKPRVWEQLPVHPLVDPVPEPQGLPIASMLNLGTDNNRYAMLRWASQFEIDSARELIQQMFPREVENEQLAINHQGRSMSIWGEPDLVRTVKAEFLRATSVVGRPIELHVELLSLTGDDLPPTILPGGRAPVGEVLWQSTATARSGERLHLDATSATRYVRRNNVEVAQSAAIANPVVARYGEGVAVDLQAHALCDSEDVVIHLQFAAGRARRVETLSTGVPGHSPIDVPELDSAFGCASARVPAGGSLQVVLGGEPARGLCAVLRVSVRYPTPRPDEPQRIVLLPCSALTAGNLLARPQLERWPGAAADPDSLIEFDEQPQFEIDELMEMVRNCLGDGSPTSVSAAGGYIVLGNIDAEQAAPVRRLLTGLQDQRLQNLELRLDASLAEVRGHGALSPEQNGGQRRPAHRLALPCLPGRVGALFRMVETLAISGQESSIAAKESEPVTVVTDLQSGVWLTAVPSLVPGGVAPDLQVRWSAASTPERRNLAPAGTLMLWNSAQCSFRRSFPVAEGRTIELGRGPVLQDGDRGWAPVLQFAVATGAAR